MDALFSGIKEGGGGGVRTLRLIPPTNQLCFHLMFATIETGVKWFQGHHTNANSV